MWQLQLWYADSQPNGAALTSSESGYNSSADGKYRCVRDARRYAAVVEDRWRNSCDGRGHTHRQVEVHVVWNDSGELFEELLTGPIAEARLVSPTDDWVFYNRNTTAVSSTSSTNF